MHPHTESDMTAILLSATELAPVIQKPVVPKNNRKIRPLPNGVMEVVISVQLHPDLILKANLPVALNSLPDLVNFRIKHFKDEKFKSPKAHPTIALHAKFRNAGAKRAQPYYGRIPT